VPDAVKPVCARFKARSRAVTGETFHLIAVRSIPVRQTSFQAVACGAQGRETGKCNKWPSDRMVHCNRAAPKKSDPQPPQYQYEATNSLGLHAVGPCVRPRFSVI
jgi:hypothetical protein